MDTKGTLTKLVVGETTAFEVHKFLKVVEQFAFSLKGEDDYGYGHLLFPPDGQRDYKAQH